MTLPQNLPHQLIGTFVHLSMIFILALIAISIKCLIQRHGLGQCQEGYLNPRFELDTGCKSTPATLQDLPDDLLEKLMEDIFFDDLKSLVHVNQKLREYASFSYLKRLRALKYVLPYEGGPFWCVDIDQTIPNLAVLLLLSAPPLVGQAIALTCDVFVIAEFCYDVVEFIRRNKVFRFTAKCPKQYNHLDHCVEPQLRNGKRREVFVPLVHLNHTGNALIKLMAHLDSHCTTIHLVSWFPYSIYRPNKRLTSPPVSSCEYSLDHIRDNVLPHVTDLSVSSCFAAVQSFQTLVSLLFQGPSIKKLHVEDLRDAFDPLPDQSFSNIEHLSIASCCDPLHHTYPTWAFGPNLRTLSLVRTPCTHARIPFSIPYAFELEASSYLNQITVTSDVEIAQNTLPTINHLTDVHILPAAPNLSPVLPDFEAHILALTRPLRWFNASQASETHLHLHFPTSFVSHVRLFHQKGTNPACPNIETWNTMHTQHLTVYVTSFSRSVFHYLLCFSRAFQHLTEFTIKWDKDGDADFAFIPNLLYYLASPQLTLFICNMGRWERYGSDWFASVPER